MSARISPDHVVLPPDRALHLCRHFRAVSAVERRRLRTAGLSDEAVDAELGMAGSHFIAGFSEGPFGLLSFLEERLVAGDAAVTASTAASGAIRYEAVFRFSREDWPTGIGTDGVVDLSEVSRDSATVVRREERGGYSVSVVYHVEAPPTWRVNLVAVAEGDVPQVWQVTTAFPGMMAPPFPAQSRQSAETYGEALKFWSRHGLVGTDAL